MSKHTEAKHTETKHADTQASRLICVGGAKRCTNASIGKVDELDNGAQFD
jgi:hypothetical protein